MKAPRAQAAAPLAWGPDGRWLAHALAGASVVSISRVDAQTQGPSSSVYVHPVGHLTLAEPVQSLAVSPDGLWLAVGHPQASTSLYAVDLDAVGSWPLVSRAALPPDDVDDPDDLTQLAFSPAGDTLVLASGRRVHWLRLDVAALQAALAAAQAPVPSAETQAQANADSPAEPAAALAVLSVEAHEPQRWSFRLQSGAFNWAQELRLASAPLPPELLRALLGLDERRVPGPRGMAPRAAQALVALQKELLPPRLLPSLAAETGAAPPLGLRTDEHTRHPPWELLLRDGDNPPLAVQRGLVRLAMQQTGTSPVLPADAEALVIHLDDTGQAPPDPLAATLHHRLSLAFGARVTLLRQPTRDGLLKLLGDAEHRLVYFIDRSDALRPPQRKPGLPLSPDSEPLRPRDLLRPLPPELVFLGWPGSSDWAPELLRAGVRAVVTLDWGLDPEGAWAFSDEFTRALAAGFTLVDAARQARQSAYTRHPESSAWAAYQVHGDPLYRLQREPVPAPAADADATTALATPGEDVVVMTLKDGPDLVLHPQTAQDLMAADDAAGREPRGTRESTLAPGFLRNVLQSLNVLRGDPETKGRRALEELVQRVDARSAKGLLALSPEAWPDPPRPVSSTPDSAGPPLLVLVHGLLSSGEQTFGALWSQHPEVVAQLFRHHGERVYALEHPTLGQDPLDAALQLARVCAPGTRLTLLTHSSGGLVAECLVRAALDDAGQPLPSLPRFRQRSAELVNLVRSRRLQVQRVVRVACPARGSLLASGRLDAFLSVLKWSLELSQAVVPTELLELVQVVAQQRTDPATLPGLAALAPDNPLLQWLYGSAGSARSELRVVAGDLEGDGVGSWAKTLLADAFYNGDNDLVVQTHAMYGGVPREGGSLFLLDQGPQVTHFNYFRNPRTVQAVVDALLQDRPAGFAPVGPLSWAGESASGLR
ncbi:hypothetical protein BurJ1DRAFT_4890 [Burkholderiales bacterium JOSHI_001]|nr:hypothetical protein BurJ1DRAFT_4890 [Burkholderiales bacterium JOSHI_001]